MWFSNYFVLLLLSEVRNENKRLQPKLAQFYVDFLGQILWCETTYKFNYYTLVYESLRISYTSISMQNMSYLTPCARNQIIAVM